MEGIKYLVMLRVAQMAESSGVASWDMGRFSDWMDEKETFEFIENMTGESICKPEEIWALRKNGCIQNIDTGRHHYFHSFVRLTKKGAELADKWIIGYAMANESEFAGSGKSIYEFVINY